MKKPKPYRPLILCSDYAGIVREINRQLTDTGITVKILKNKKEWADRIAIDVKKPVTSVSFETPDFPDDFKELVRKMLTRNRRS
jgi:hypothetical protein